MEVDSIYYSRLSKTFWKTVERGGFIAMTLGDVLKKERTNKKLTIEKVAEELKLSLSDYEQWEAGQTPIEEWGPKLALLAIKLSKPTSRLLAKSGKSKDVAEGKCGSLIQGHREEKELSLEKMAELVNMSVDEYKQIEVGESPVEKYGWRFLRFAELIEQPVFNLFYPCGLPFQQLNDYP